SDRRSAGTRPRRWSFTPQLQARVTVESLLRSRKQALASRHDRAQFPHHPAIARRSAASAPPVRLELLRERQEALAPPPASIGTAAAHAGASAARPGLPAEWSKGPLPSPPTRGTAIVPPHASESGRRGRVPAAMNAEGCLEVVRDALGDRCFRRTGF